jgi:hypothetical protein
MNQHFMTPRIMAPFTENYLAETQNMFETAHLAITELNLWDWLRELDMSNQSFAMMTHPNLTAIWSHIENQPNNPRHSGATFVLTMMQMHLFANM